MKLAKTAAKIHAFLQRQGVGRSLKCYAGRFYFEFACWQDQGLYVGEVMEATPSKVKDWPDEYHVLWKTERPTALESILKEVEARFGIEFDSRIEAYSYEPKSAWEIWPHIKSDVFRTCAVYEKSTDTVRHAKTNVCILAFAHPDELISGTNEDGVIYDVDPAAKPYEEIARRAVAEYKKSHNQRNAPEENKAWLAWLIGEWIKDDLKEQPEIVTSMIREKGSDHK